MRKKIFQQEWSCAGGQNIDESIMDNHFPPILTHEKIVA